MSPHAHPSVVPMTRHVAHDSTFSAAGADTRFYSLLQALPVAVVLLDGHGCVSVANPPARELLGDPLVNQFWRDVVARVFQAPVGGDLRLRSGRRVTLSTRPLAGEPGQLLLLSDVTDARRLEARVEHSRRLADMGRMAATLAHQVRTPLASALLYASQLGQPELTEERRKTFTQKMIGRLRELEQLVRDMLVFARGDAGGGEIIEATALLRSAQEAAAEQMSLHNVAVRVKEAAPVHIRGNPNLLKSALLNLVSNALRAIPEGGSIEIYAQSGLGDSVDLCVSDDGPGVPVEMRASLFAPFSTTRDDGAGLGLAAVRAVARAHGGDAWHQPRAGGGSVFGLRLPIIAGTTAATETQGAAATD